MTKSRVLQCFCIVKSVDDELILFCTCQLELGQKWDGLDFFTGRNIPTLKEIPLDIDEYISLF